MSTPRKTNALRILESLGIAHDVALHPVAEEHFNAVEVARLLGVSSDVLFKTLVARGGPEEVFVFCIPGNAELDLKKAARVTGARKVDLVPLKELTSLTGYVRGGCSPIGMKKKFPTWIDEIAAAQETIYVNAGARGMQVRIAPTALLRAADARYADLV
ncbi:MAG: Cys-tRNA(Pro) deacylase [Spirochaetia bacterium]|jgi:Cys-tRNA(Pro)/Cys-tRNA(Cys) deacylase